MPCSLEGDSQTPTLTDTAAQALANLLPLLGCGEEAAAVAFHHLADKSELDRETSDALRLIGDEEHVHDALLTRLSLALPTPENAAEIRRTARRFHIGLSAGSATLHLARIAAIDAAVCMMLSRLTRQDAALSSDPAMIALFRQIRNDEAKHVAVARTIANRARNRRPLREAAANARAELSTLIKGSGAAFETLGVNPDVLIRDVARLPNGLI